LFAPNAAGVALLAALLSSCGGGSGNATVSSVSPATVLFPPSHSFTESDSIVVSGTSRIGGVQGPLRVNGVVATTSNNFVDWNATVPLDLGVNLLRVTARNGRLLRTLEVERGVPLRNPKAIAFDSQRNRVLVTDPWMSALIAIDLTSGERRVLSDATTPNDAMPFVVPIDVELDTTRDRAVVLDRDGEQGRLVAVDLTSGVRSALSAMLDEPVDAAIDATTDRAFVLTGPPISRVGGDLRAVDLSSGVDSPVLPPPIGNGPFSPRLVPCPDAIGFDSNQGRVLVGSCNSVSGVDPATGSISFVASLSLPLGARMVSMTFDAQTDRGFGAVPFFGVVAWDSTSLTSESVWNRATIAGLTFDAANGRLLATDNLVGSIEAFEPASQTETTLASYHVPDRDNEFGYIQYVDIDETANRALITAVEPPADLRLIAVDLETGRRTLMSSNALADSGEPITSAAGFAFQAESNRTLLTDPAAARVLSIDATTGVRSVLSENSAPAEEPLLAFPLDVALDRPHDRALVLNGGSAAVLTLDLTTGQRRVLSDASTPDDQTPLELPMSLALDSKRNRALVANLALLDPDEQGLVRVERQIIAVDLETGQRTLLWTSEPVAVGPPIRVVGLAFDARADRILLPDMDSQRVISIDAVTGAASSLTDATRANYRGHFEPLDVGVDGSTGRIFVIDTPHELLAVDRNTGDRVVLSR
jgi:hypothetical protein